MGLERWVVKSIYCSWSGSEFESQHAHGDSQLSMTSGPAYPKPSSDFLGSQVHTHSITFVHINFLLKPSASIHHGNRHLTIPAIVLFSQKWEFIPECTANINEKQWITVVLNRCFFWWFITQQKLIETSICVSILCSIDSYKECTLSMYSLSAPNKADTQCVYTFPVKGSLYL